MGTAFHGGPQQGGDALGMIGEAPDGAGEIGNELALGDIDADVDRSQDCRDGIHVGSFIHACNANSPARAGGSGNSSNWRRNNPVRIRLRTDSRLRSERNDELTPGGSSGTAIPGDPISAR